MTIDSPSIETLIGRALAPGHFYVAPGHCLLFPAPQEETIRWEVFRGQLLDARHTRAQETFRTFHVQLAGDAAAPEPLLSLRVSPFSSQGACELHVTRWLHCRVWEAVDENGAIASQERERWIEELVGTIQLSETQAAHDQDKEIEQLLLHAFVGLSRLPLHSIEAPLPIFSLGRASYFASLPAGESPVTNPLDLLATAAGQSPMLEAEFSRRLEFFLRTATSVELESGARAMARKLADAELSQPEFLKLLRRVFNDTSLTPFTEFVDNAIRFVGLIFESGLLSAGAFADLLLGLVRQTVYHLTAYDLGTFHHQGANYPDALFLDALLRWTLPLLVTHPKLLSDGDNESDILSAQDRRRRRALLLGWWMHRLLDGLPVPDFPTSPGENRRILPAPHGIVPEEQFTHPTRRNRRLFEGQGIDWEQHKPVLEVALAEIGSHAFLLELGTALYLDRSLGSSRPAATLDLTPLLSYRLFSRNVARSRLGQIGRLECSLTHRADWPETLEALEKMPVQGIPVPPPAGPGRNIRLQDCWRSADDYLILAATAETVRQLRSHFRWERCPEPLRTWHEHKLLPVPMPGSVPGQPTKLLFFDDHQRVIAECEVLDGEGFPRLGALELPVPGLITSQDGEKIVIESIFR
jgi:hypothetical protein